MYLARFSYDLLPINGSQSETFARGVQGGLLSRRLCHRDVPENGDRHLN